MTRIISYSELFTWDSCPRQYYYSHDLNIRPQVMSEAIDTGTQGHKLLQSFYEALKSGDTKEIAHKRTQVAASTVLSEASITEMKDLLKAWTLVDNYIRDNEFKSESVLVENRFLIPMSLFTSNPELDDVQVGFTPDVVFKRGNFLDVEDSKFIGRAWSKKKVNRFSQAKLYQIFLKLLGYNVTRTTVRFFNTTTGKITPQHYILGQDERVILIRDFVTAVEEVLAFRAKEEYVRSIARRVMNNNACQYCWFEEICTTESEGKDASKIIKYQFKKSDYDYGS